MLTLLLSSKSSKKCGLDKLSCHVLAEPKTKLKLETCQDVKLISDTELSM